MSNFKLTNWTVFDKDMKGNMFPVKLDLTWVSIHGATLIATGLRKAEKIYVWVSQDNGETFARYVVKGKQLSMTAENSALELKLPLLYGFTKMKTGLPVTLTCQYLSRDKNE